MSRTPPHGNGDRVTNAQLYQELSKVPTRRELWLVLVAGQTIASLVAATITKMTPPQQAQALAALLLHLF